MGRDLKDFDDILIIRDSDVKVFYRALRRFRDNVILDKPVHLINLQDGVPIRETEIVLELAPSEEENTCLFVSEEKESPLFVDQDFYITAFTHKHFQELARHCDENTDDPVHMSISEYTKVKMRDGKFSIHGGKIPINRVILSKKVSVPRQHIDDRSNIFQSEGSVFLIRDSDAEIFSNSLTGFICDDERYYLRKNIEFISVRGWSGMIYAFRTHPNDEDKIAMCYEDKSSGENYWNSLPDEFRVVFVTETTMNKNRDKVDFNSPFEYYVQFYRSGPRYYRK